MTEALAADHVRVAVIGAGFAGLGMAIRLRTAGERDFVVLERADEVGGAWRDNTYPGAACDVPADLYSYSFAPNPEWTSSFSTQPEIQSYLQWCVRRYGLGGHLRLGHEVRAARWDGATGRWELDTTGGRFTATVLVCGTGQLSEPAVPELAGLDGFEGAAFHSARWDHTRELAGAHVGVVGTGASAVQLVPEIADRASRVSVFQRSAPWVLPRGGRQRPRVERAALRRVPGMQRLGRAAEYWTRECSLLGFSAPRVMRAVSLLARANLRRQVPEPDLRAALTPGHPMGCKRVLRSDTFYPALRRPHVELVTDPIREVRPRGVVTADGTHRDVDTLVFGTGFRAAEPPIAHRIRGRGGRLLADEWSAAGPQAYLGTAVAGFANLFLLLGPNSSLAHNSVVLTIESQVEYVLDALRVLRERDVAALEVRPEAQADFVAGVRARTAGTVWNAGCSSWYLDRAGRNTTIWPGFTGRFRRLTGSFDPADYLLHPVAHEPAPSPSCV